MLDPTRMDDVLRRGGEVAKVVGAWKSLDEQRRKLQGELDGFRKQRNAANEGMAKADKKSLEFATMRDELKALSTKIKEGEAQLTLLEGQSEAELLNIPNAPHASVPDGANEADNPLLHTWGSKPSFAFQPKPHWEVGEQLGILDFNAGAKITGARFTVLRNGASKLTRALINYMLDLHTSHGYSEVWPPAIVARRSLRGTGQLPKFEDDLFKLHMPPNPDHVAENDLFLSPTAEVQVTNLHADEILDADQLPKHYCAYSACFRAEAGAAGKDTRGLIRQHQFDKIELVSITTPDESEGEHERMTQAAENVLDRLDLPYRRMLLCAGDMGFTSKKTYDLEVWLPGQSSYREISSCSNCGDFQARRMATRYRATGEKATRFVHTLNGSGVAIGRALVAVLENYQQDGGAVHVPEALIPYMGGATRLVP